MEWLKRNWLTVALVIVAVVYLADYLGAGIVSHIKDKAFERKQAELMAERDIHIKRGDEAEARAEAAEADKEGERLKHEIVIAQSGVRAEQLREKVNAEDAKLQTELDVAGITIEPCERVKRLCSRLHIKPEDCECQ